MKRDMDLIRRLLLRIESDPLFDGNCQIQPTIPADLGITDQSYEKVVYHLNQLIDEGYVKGKTTMHMPIICQLTWNGHKLLDEIRNPDSYKDEVVTLKPGLWGLSLDLKALWRRVAVWRRGRPR